MKFIFKYRPKRIGPVLPTSDNVTPYINRSQLSGAFTPPRSTRFFLSAQLLDPRDVDDTQFNSIIAMWLARYYIINYQYVYYEDGAEKLTAVVKDNIKGLDKKTAKRLKRWFNDKRMKDFLAFLGQGGLSSPALYETLQKNLVASHESKDETGMSERVLGLRAFITNAMLDRKMGLSFFYRLTQRSRFRIVRVYRRLKFRFTCWRLKRKKKKLNKPKNRQGPEWIIQTTMDSMLDDISLRIMDIAYDAQQIDYHQFLHENSSGSPLTHYLSYLLFERGGKGLRDISDSALTLSWLTCFFTSLLDLLQQYQQPPERTAAILAPSEQVIEWLHQGNRRINHEAFEALRAALSTLLQPLGLTVDDPMAADALSRRLMPLIQSLRTVSPTARHPALAFIEKRKAEKIVLDQFFDGLITPPSASCESAAQLDSEPHHEQALESDLGKEIEEDANTITDINANVAGAGVSTAAPQRSMLSNPSGDTTASESCAMQAVLRPISKDKAADELLIYYAPDRFFSSLNLEMSSESSECAFSDDGASCSATLDDASEKLAGSDQNMTPLSASATR